MSDTQKAMFFDALVEAGVLDWEGYENAKSIYFAKQDEANGLGGE